MLRENMSTLSASLRLQAVEAPISQDRSRSAAAMADLFGPLDGLLRGGGDPRLDIDPTSGANEYGCEPFPCPGTLSFASSTATSISARAYARAAEARDSLMRSAIAIGIDGAFEARIEAIRDELKAHLGISGTRADVIFAPSGTDAQLHALFLTRALRGPALTTVIVAADQTGSGTADTARGHHFRAATANGVRVRKGEPIAGLADSVASVALPLFDDGGDFRPQTETDSRVLSAIEKLVASGSNVLFQVMDSSKLGWRVPSEACLEEISLRWPQQVQVVVDACQMRLGRPRLRKYLDRGYLVIVTGSKFFTGPPFSGALLVPAVLSKALDAVPGIASGLREYSSRSDWPMRWSALRARFPVRTNFGQWLRWEAALEEIHAYYSVPDEFRLLALTTFRTGVERIIASSPFLRPLPPQQKPDGAGADDEELAQTTIFPFAIRRGDRLLSPSDCRKIYRGLACDAQDAVVASGLGCAPEIAAKPCLIGQPVALNEVEQGPVAALRISASARLVTDTWSPDRERAHDNLQRELGHVGAIVSKIEWLLAHLDGLNVMEIPRAS